MIEFLLNCCMLHSVSKIHQFSGCVNCPNLVKNHMEVVCYQYLILAETNVVKTGNSRGNSVLAAVESR